MENRINALDGFRFLAISLVAVFHYYSRFTLPQSPVNYYPYGNSFNNVFSANAYLGVHFFFIISGYVIYFSILRSSHLKDFFLRRFIRLFPPLLLASVITFVFVAVADPQQAFPFHVSVFSFLPSLTFTDPLFWQPLLKGHKIALIDGAYWSLLVEVKFYVLIALIYFLLPREKFLRNWTSLMAVLLVVHTLAAYVHFPMSVAIRKAMDIFFFYNYIAFFSAGICFYDFYIHRKWRPEYLVTAVMAGITLWSLGWAGMAFMAVFLVLFTMLVNGSHLLGFFALPMVRRIGVISYTLYLLHQFIGLILINAICKWVPAEVLWPAVPVFVYALLIVVTELIYRFYEEPVRKLLTNYYFPKRVPVPMVEKQAA
ncbi:acyltransferase [Chitinophaga sp. Cy-1792]|uniref:acyltransferase family protein n=1 Tax=Chitinophaga sp. Cy-1792 TaxID=2608339 RepID=UPI0014239790|nr:acyltransferase [Chitinophaga sp. Cy-1792]NIG56634.1 acyltransferase [Chitinophaga sp. Cy-1792]